MNIMGKFLALITLLLIFEPANTVARAQTPDDCDKFWAAKAVFVGKLIKAYPGASGGELDADGSPRSSNPPVLHLTFSVERAFTGSKRTGSLRPIEVECGECLNENRPRLGERFLVYAYGAGSKASYPLAVLAMTLASEAATEIESLKQLTAPGTIAYELNRVVAGIISGKAISMPRPSYPLLAKRSRVAGRVIVAIVLDPTGRVTRANAVCGHPLLRAASEKAAKKIRYTPTLLSGKPVTMGGLVNYNFEL